VVADGHALGGPAAHRFGGEEVAVGCKVTLRHGGWEALGAAAGDTRAGYASGWKRVFEGAYGEHVARALEGHHE
jgi:hypothetical protein